MGVPQENGFFLKYRFFPNINNRSLAFRTVKRFFYKDGERIKTTSGIDLLQTFLVLDIRNNYEEDQYQLKLTLYEKIKINEFGLKDTNLKERAFLKKVVQNNQYVEANTTIAQLKM